MKTFITVSSAFMIAAGALVFPEEQYRLPGAFVMLSGIIFLSLNKHF